MKVAVIHNQPLGTREAGVAFVTGAATGYALSGAETTLLAPGPVKNAKAELARLAVPDPTPFALPSLPPIRLEWGLFRPSWSGPFRKAVLGKLAAGGFDVAVVRDLKLADLLLRYDLPLKLVYEMHNLYSLGQDDARADGLFPADKLDMHRRREAMEKRVLEKVDGVIVLTEGLKKLLEPHYNLAGRIGVGGSALHPTKPPAKPARCVEIAYLGSLDPHKGVGSIVAALAELPEETRLLLVGHGRHHEALLKLAVYYGVAERLTLAGWYAPADLPERLAECFAAVVPLEDLFYNRYVTSPMKLFDYARAGVVPVIPDLPVFEELFAESGGGVIVETGTAANYAAALRKLFEDSDYRAEKEHQLRAFAARYTWQRRGEGLLRFFTRLTAGA
ncbi:MAG: glycosyltransferase [Candidatus Lernaella stagnicola]|nr:glycosyltransferase [Candidatus Lernaella stagnicola]